MGQKKDTLLRWVNCCIEAATSIDSIKNLSDGCFLNHILSSLNNHTTNSSDPWLQIINILKENKFEEDVIDYDAAASGNEDELAKLIVICMHLTMVLKPCEIIKEKTMWNLSTEDQKVIEAILLAIVNDDQLTRSRLVEVLQDLQNETSFSRTVMFYTSSPLSSMSKNSPLKRFLDSPMALRLSRLQREISDKNEEIRRLQSELMSESDETSVLTTRMEDLKRKVKELEKKNAELEQRLRDCQLPDNSCPDSDVEITQLKKQIKKMQNEYEASCQKYCDLNIEYEALKTRQEKDRKQVRQLQIELNETVARFERESAEYQLLLDSIRTENVELKHALEEKAQWIDVLEEKSRSCSEMHARLSTPRSPCERESIGYSLLSIEAEKLQDELESYRRDLACQTERFNSEKKMFQQRAAALEEDKKTLHVQVEEANITNRSLQEQLREAKTNLEQLSVGCSSLSQEKEELRLSLDTLQMEFARETNRAQEQLDVRSKEVMQLSLHIETLNRQLEETHAAKIACEQSIQELTQQKMELTQKVAALEQTHLELQTRFSANQTEFEGELREITNQLQSSQLHIATQSQNISELEEKLAKLCCELTTAEETTSTLTTEKQRLNQIKSDLEQQNSTLADAFENSKLEFQARLEKANLELEAATARITEFCDTTSSLKQQLEAALQEKLQFQSRSSQLEADRDRLCQERDALQQEVQQLLQSVQQSRDEFQAEKDCILSELESKKLEITEQGNRILSAEQRQHEAEQQIHRLESNLRTLEQEAAELTASRSLYEKQVTELKAAVDNGKTALEAAVDQANTEANIHEALIAQHKESIQSLQVNLENLSAEKHRLESHIAELGSDNESLKEQLNCLETKQKEDQASRDTLLAELETLQQTSQQQFEEQQQQLARHSEDLTALEKKLEDAICREGELRIRCEQVNDEKVRLARENEFLKEEVSGLLTSSAQQRNVFESNLNALKEELESNRVKMEESQQKILSMEGELAEMASQKAVLENEVQKLSTECCQGSEVRSQLEQENQHIKETHKGQIEEFEKRIGQLTEEHVNRIHQLDEQLEAAQNLNSSLKADCARLEKERDTLNFEKSTFEQMYLEVKSACEEAESKSHVEGELARREVEIKEEQIAQQLNALEDLERIVSSLRQEKETMESNFAKQIGQLEAEKRELMASYNLLEQQHSTLSTSAEVSRKEMEQHLAETNQKLQEHVDLLQQSHTSLQKMAEQNESLKTTISKMELDLKSAVEEKGHLTSEMSVLQAVHGEMKNLELAMEQLTSEIEELSCKKANLEKLREFLEVAKANAEEESKQLRQDVVSKDSEIAQLSARIDVAESQLAQELRDKQVLQTRISELEITVSDLNNGASLTSHTVQDLEKRLLEREATLERSTEELNTEKKQSAQAQAAFLKAMTDLQNSSDINRRDLEISIANLKRELESEKELSSEQNNTVQALTLAKKETSDLAESLQRKLTSLEAEMENLTKSEAMLRTENLRLEEGYDSNSSQLEKEKQELAETIENMQQEITKLTLQLEQTTSSCSHLENERDRLKADRLQAVQEKDQLEKVSRDIETNRNTTVAMLESRLKAMEAELQSKTTEVNEISGAADALREQLEAIVQEKQKLEQDLTGRIAAVLSEKESLLAKTATFEQENQGLRAELAAEKSKTAQGKGEIILEHRKEKAALEARLQVAQSQMKSMQEKLVNMTVANNSQAPLEHKIALLTSELEAANRAKIELEKQLSDSQRAKVELPVIKQEEFEDKVSNVPTQEFASEVTVLRKKYDTAKKALSHKDEVIGQYAAKFGKMQQQLDTLHEEVETLNTEKRKLAIENRSLKTEQQHLLARISADKDKAIARTTRHSLALQRANAGPDGGTLADTMIDARRRSLRPYRSEGVTLANQRTTSEVFRPASLAFGDGSDVNSIFKVPPSRRDSTSSVCSNRSDVSTTSRGTNVPQGAGRLFTCDDEDGELFSSSYLNEMKEGKCRVEDSSNRLSELHRRNTMQPPHMRSAYPAEMNDERLRQSDIKIMEQPQMAPKATSSRTDLGDSVQQLSLATSMLSVNTPPAMNTRKRRSSSWNQTDMETPVQPRKRRSYELDANMSCDSSESRSISSSVERKKHLDSSRTSYQRPGPPTPAKNTTKENTLTPSISSSPPKATPKQLKKPGSKRASPTPGSKTSKLTPASIVKRVQAKIRSNIQSSSENTPSSTRTTPRGSKLNIFRKPLGSRSYNSDAAKF